MFYSLEFGDLTSYDILSGVSLLEIYSCDLTTST